MIALPFMIAAAIAGAHPEIRVLDGSGFPVAGALVRFIDATSHAGAERTDAGGRAVDPSDTPPVAIEVIAAGFAALREPYPLPDGGSTIVVQRDPRLVGVIRIATGSPQDLHSLPVSAASLDLEALSARAAVTADSLLRVLPGFDYTRSNSAFTNYGQLRVSFNGAGQNRGAVFVDGVPAQDGFGGQIDWAAYPPEDLARAELLLGAGSALYGSGAVGGALNLFTFAPTSATRSDGFASVSAGTHQTDSSAVAYRTALGPRAAASVFASDRRSAYFDFPPGFTSPVDYPAAQSASSAEHVRVRLGGGSSSWDFGALASADQQQQGRPNYWVTRRVDQLDGTYQWQASHAAVTLTAYGRSGWVTNVADRFPTAPGLLRYVQSVPTQERGASAAWLVQGGDWEFQVRTDQRWVRGATDQVGPSGALQNSASGTQWLGGVALQETLRRERFEALFGLRADRVSSFSMTMVASGAAPGTYIVSHPPSTGFAALSPRAALRYDLTPTVAVRASAGGGFRAPYLNELLRGFQIGSTVFAPNPALVAERSRSGSVGLDALVGQGRLTLDYSGLEVQDAIAFQTISPTLQKRANIEQTRTDGLTATYIGQLGSASRMHLSITAQHARVTAGPAALVGKQLVFVPDASADVGVDSSAGSFGFGADVAYLGQTYADDLNTQPLGRAVVVDLKVCKRVSGNLLAVLEGANVTNQTYLSSQDRLAPPAMFSLKLVAPIGSRHAASTCM